MIYQIKRGKLEIQIHIWNHFYQKEDQLLIMRNQREAYQIINVILILMN